MNEDPIPTFHELEKNYSSGYLNVPVVGAGTANTEFEMLTGLWHAVFRYRRVSIQDYLKADRLREHCL